MTGDFEVPPHQERVINERTELADKVEKLGRFLFGSLFDSLHSDEQKRLVKQYAYMKLYLEVIDERVAAF